MKAHTYIISAHMILATLQKINMQINAPYHIIRSVSTAIWMEKFAENYWVCKSHFVYSLLAIDAVTDHTKLWFYIFFTIYRSSHFNIYYL